MPPGKGNGTPRGCSYVGKEVMFIGNKRDGGKIYKKGVKSEKDNF